jgi:serine/threonine-protein kinase SIK2
LEEGPSGDELREAQIKLEEHRLGLDHDISQRIDSQIVNRRLSDYQHHFDNTLMDPIDPPSRTTLFMASGSGNSSSELFESSFDSGCPPDYAGTTNCFTSSLPSCTPPPPKSPSPITGRISRVSQGRRASDGGPRLLFYQQGVGDARPSKQRSIQGACIPMSRVSGFLRYRPAGRPTDRPNMITR